MLIDATYFRGNINIPNTNDAAVLQRLNWFIENYEEELLKDVLGIDLYNEFIEGLLEDPVDTLWTDLLYGAQYVGIDGRAYEWMGLVHDPGGVLSVGLQGKRTVIVGRGEPYDPVANSSTTTIPPEMVGKQFMFSQRSIGFLDTDEYTTSGSTLTLSGGRAFSAGDRYYYIPISLSITSGIGTVKRSLIANYIYYWWMRDQATQSSGVGEVVTKTENSARASGDAKAVVAYNDMCYQLWRMWDFLEVNKLFYSAYVPDFWTRNKYRTINTVNI